MEIKEFEGEWWVKAEDAFKELKKMNEDKKMEIKEFEGEVWVRADEVFAELKKA